jgi:hypothetical protein
MLPDAITKVKPKASKPKIEMAERILSRFDTELKCSVHIENRRVSKMRVIKAVLCNGLS